MDFLDVTGNQKIGLSTTIPVPVAKCYRISYFFLLLNK